MVIDAATRHFHDAHALRTEHADVLARRAQFGPNVLPRAQERSLARVFLDQFRNIIVLLLPS